MIDEFPVLFVAAALAQGRTVTRGLDELRVKESDRLAAMAAALTAAGARVEERADGLVIDGTGGEPLRGAANARIATHLDHRIAMSMAVAGLASRDGRRGRRHPPDRHQLPGVRDAARRSSRA